VAQHDLVPALGHDRQLFAGLVGPQAKAQKPVPVASPMALTWRTWRALGAGFMQVDQRRARQFKLTGRFKADIAIRALQAMTLPPS
jgi:hypothetical protein